VSKKEDLPAPAAAGTNTFAVKAIKKPIEHWASVHKTEDWLFVTVKAAAFRNIEGFEVSEAGYLAAVQHTLNTPIGYTSAGVRATRDKHASIDPTDPKAVAAYEAAHVRKAGAR
jgi:hypothetical protein